MYDSVNSGFRTLESFDTPLHHVLVVLWTAVKLSACPQFCKPLHSIGGSLRSDELTGSVVHWHNTLICFHAETS